MLVSVGRRPNSAGSGLENTQVEIDRKGFVVVDDQLRTADPHILAIGDVAGEPMLAHKATHEGKVAVEVLLGEPAVVRAARHSGRRLHRSGNRLGRPDRGASQGRRRSQIEVARYPWAASGRAQALGRTEGFTKLLIDPETERVLGIGMVGINAGDLIAEGVLAIEMGATCRDIAETIHPHPTLSETVMNAAEVFFGTATEIYRPRKRAARPRRKPVRRRRVRGPHPGEPPRQELEQAASKPG